MTRDRLLAALMGPEPLSNDEWAEKQIAERQRSCVTVVRDVFARMRRHIPAESAATAGEIGHHELNQAITTLLARWAEQERELVNRVRSSEFASKAKTWLLRQLERESCEPTGSIPDLVIWQHVLPGIASGVFNDADDDKVFRECLRQAIVSGAAKTGGKSDDPNTLLSQATLADRLGIPANDRRRRDALRKRLEKWRNASKGVESFGLTLTSRDAQLAVHGNRFIEHILLAKFPNNIDPKVISDIHQKLSIVISELYSDSYLAVLFKNTKKCEVIKETLLARL